MLQFFTHSEISKLSDCIHVWFTQVEFVNFLSLSLAMTLLIFYAIRNHLISKLTCIREVYILRENFKFSLRNRSSCDTLIITQLWFWENIIKTKFNSNEWEMLRVVRVKLYLRGIHSRKIFIDVNINFSTLIIFPVLCVNHTEGYQRIIICK